MDRYIWRLKACPRCSGDMSFDNSDEHKQWACIQCGFRKDNAAGDALAPEKGDPEANKLKDTITHMKEIYETGD